MTCRALICAAAFAGILMLCGYLGEIFWLDSGKMAASCFVVGCGMGILGVVFLIGGKS